MLEEIFEAVQGNPKATDIIRAAVMKAAGEHGPDCEPGLLVISAINNVKLSRIGATTRHRELVASFVIPKMETVYRKYRPNF